MKETRKRTIRKRIRQSLSSSKMKTTTTTTTTTTTNKRKKMQILEEGKLFFYLNQRKMNVVVVVVVRAHLLKGKLIISKKRLKDLINNRNRINRNMTSLEKI